MTHKEISTHLFDNSIRFGKMLYLASVLSAPEDLPDDFDDYIDDITFGDINPPPGLECLKEAAIKADELYDEWAVEILTYHGKFGFLVQAEVAIPVYHTEDTFSMGFGYCQLGWFYGEDMAAICAQAVAWRDDIHEKAKAKYRAKAGAA